MQHSLRHPVAAHGAVADHAGLREIVPAWGVQALRWFRSSRVDILWVIFVGINLAAMRLLPTWQTVPFLAIWVSLTVIYGFRLWRLEPAMLNLLGVTPAARGRHARSVLQGHGNAR